MKNKEFVKDSSWIMARLLLSLILTFSIPIFLLKRFSEFSYSMWIIAYSIPRVLLLLDFGMNLSVISLYPKDSSSAVSSGIGFYTFIGLILSSLFVFVGIPVITPYYQLTGDFILIFFGFGISLIPLSISKSMDSILKGQGKFRISESVLLSQEFCNILLLFSVYLGIIDSLLILSFGFVITEFIRLFILFYSVYQTVRSSFSLQNFQIKNFIGYARAMGAHRLFNIATVETPRYILPIIGSPHWVVLYDLAFRIAGTFHQIMIQLLPAVIKYLSKESHAYFFMLIAVESFSCVLYSISFLFLNVLLSILTINEVLFLQIVGFSFVFSAATNVPIASLISRSEFQETFMLYFFFSIVTFCLSLILAVSFGIFGLIIGVVLPWKICDILLIEYSNRRIVSKQKNLISRGILLLFIIIGLVSLSLTFGK